jgi:hypothetical protein
MVVRQAMPFRTKNSASQNDANRDCFLVVGNAIFHRNSMSRDPGAILSLLALFQRVSAVVGGVQQVAQKRY